ncbi:DUF2804 family protein [Tessaracoccus lacteus]
MRERELTYPVSLTDAHGRFNREAHGWARANVGILASSTTQVFGTWSGTWTHGSVVVAFDALVGFAEETHQLW